MSFAIRVVWSVGRWAARAASGRVELLSFAVDSLAIEGNELCVQMWAMGGDQTEELRDVMVTD